ncbi:MAG: signal peptidase I [Lachnospiraceae bacterium]|nr:signal peptidase I [Lachnospiraceae bacterium]
MKKNNQKLFKGRHLRRKDFKSKKYRSRRYRRKQFGGKKLPIKPDRHLLVEICKWVFKIVIVCFLAFVSVWYMGQRVSTIGDSMSPLLKNGDVVLTNRIVYNATTPKRGDIIIFKPKGNNNDHYYIKRIVGMPGETIQVIENNIYINGKKLDEDYATSKISDAGIIGEPTKIASDEYFVLGDDRENSEDSRNADIGNVKRSYIYGKAWFVVSPRKHFGFVR